MNYAGFLREKAARCRALADENCDVRTQSELTTYALSLDERAHEHERKVIRPLV
jgi:hypothetical protein